MEPPSGNGSRMGGAGDAVAAVPAMRPVRIRRCARPVPWYIAVLRLHGIVHGAMGLPIHRDPGGTVQINYRNLEQLDEITRRLERGG